MEQGQAYLEQELGKIVDKNALDGIVQYLICFDITRQQRDMVQYLEEMYGKSPTYGNIISNYAKIVSSKSLTIPTDLKISNDLVRTNELHGNLNTSYSLKHGSGRQIIEDKDNLESKYSLMHLKSSKYDESKKRNHKKATGKSAIIENTTHFCHCMATQHEFFSSCTSCGRIVCKIQISKFCSYCSALILPPMSESDAVDNKLDESTISAYKQKVFLYSTNLIQTTGSLASIPCLALSVIHI